MLTPTDIKDLASPDRTELVIKRLKAVMSITRNVQVREHLQSNLDMMLMSLGSGLASLEELRELGARTLTKFPDGDGPELFERMLDGAMQDLQRSAGFSAVQNDKRLLAALMTARGKNIGVQYAYRQWAKHSFPTFNLMPDFFDAIGATDFGDPTDEQMHMPFPAFLLTVPQSSRLPTSKMLVYRLNTGQSDSYRVSLLGANIQYSWPATLSRKQASAYINEGLDAGITNESERTADEQMVRYIRASFTLLNNVLTYIEAAGVLPDEKRRRGVPAAPVERVNKKRPIFDVGRCIKLDGRLREHLRTADASDAKWKLAHRHVVRGHWKGQPCGPGRTQRKRIWVEPFWRGPENAAVALARTYEVVG